MCPRSSLAWLGVASLPLRERGIRIDAADRALAHCFTFEFRGLSTRQFPRLAQVFTRVILSQAGMRTIGPITRFRNQKGLSPTAALGLGAAVSTHSVRQVAVVSAVGAAAAPSSTAQKYRSRPSFFQSGSSMGLYNIGPGIWGADHTINRLGLPLTTRMTVMLLDGGGLALHSPCSFEATVGDLQRLGPVTHLIAPNNVHHMFIDQFRAAFPDALLCVSEGLIPKHPDWKGLPNLRVLPRWNPAAASEATVGGGQPSSAGQPSQQQPPSATGAGLGSGPQPYPLPGTTHGEVQCLYVYGNKNDETAFYHVPSRSLVITDTAMHLGSEQALPTRLFAKATGWCTALMSLDYGSTRGSLQHVREPSLSQLNLLPCRLLFTVVRRQLRPPIRSRPTQIRPVQQGPGQAVHHVDAEPVGL